MTAYNQPSTIFNTSYSKPLDLEKLIPFDISFVPIVFFSSLLSILCFSHFLRLSLSSLLPDFISSRPQWSVGLYTAFPSETSLSLLAPFSAASMYCVGFSPSLFVLASSFYCLCLLISASSMSVSLCFSVLFRTRGN